MVDMIAFDEMDLRRTLARVGITMEVKFGEVVFSNGKERWATDMVRV